MATYTFTWDLVSGKLGPSLSFSYPAAGGDSASTPLTLVEGDVLQFTCSGTPDQGAEVYTWIEDSINTQIKITNPSPINCPSGGTGSGTILKIGTSNVVSTLYFIYFGVGSRLIYYRINSDSIPAVPSISDITNQPINSDATTSFTVSGLSTSKAAHYLSLFNDSQLKVNSGSYSSNVVAQNGDTITVKIPTASTYDTITRAYIFTEDGAGNGISKAINAVTAVNPAGTYGVQVWNSSGVKTLDVGSRTGRIVATGSTTLSFPSVSSGSFSSDSNTITVSGMQNTDDWAILTDLGQGDTTAPYIFNYTVTKNSGSFTIAADINASNAPDTVTVKYEVLKVG